MKFLKGLIRLVVALLVIAAIVAGAKALAKRKQRALAQAPKYGVKPTPVRVAVARSGKLMEKRDYLAVLEPVREAKISARITATIDKVPRDEGDAVQAGDVLIALDDRQIRESIEAMKAKVEQANADLAANNATVQALAHTVSYWDRERSRDSTLAGKGAIPGAQADATVDKATEARGKLDAAKQKSAAIARLVESLKRQQAELETTLSYCTIRAPFKGVIAQRLVDPGDLASPGKTLMVAYDHSTHKLSFDVPQQDLPLVREGLDVTFVVHGQPHQVKLSHLFPSLNLARMVRAEAALDGEHLPGLACGAYVPVSVILSKKDNATLVPAACLVESPDRKPYVFVAHEGQLEARPVTVQSSSGGDIAVQGVKPGEQVVVSTFLGWALLASGQKVEVVQ